jgi:hypothetical protein
MGPLIPLVCHKNNHTFGISDSYFGTTFNTFGPLIPLGLQKALIPFALIPFALIHFGV